MDDAVKTARAEEATRKQVDELRGKKIDMVIKQSRPTPKKCQWRRDEPITLEIVEDVESTHTKENDVQLNLPFARR